jgi:hypothetical protein
MYISARITQGWNRRTVWLNCRGPTVVVFKISIIGLFWTEVAAAEFDYLLYHIPILSILSSKAASFNHDEFDCLSIDLGLLYYYIYHSALYFAILAH